MVSFGTSRFHFFHAIVCLGMILAARPLEAAGISVKFDRHAPAATPMPSNLFTVPAPEHTTGREVRLPLPDCAAHPSDCTLVAALNTLDGFNLQPRLSIPFTGSIDPHTATEETVFLLRLSDPRGHSVSTSPQHVEKIALNQLVWDATSQTLHAESDEFLQQNTHYALIVTRSVRDGFGRKLSRRGFLRFLKRLYSTPDGWPYLYELSSAVVAARAAGISFTDLAGVSVFTTQTTTTALERIRGQLLAAEPPSVNFRLAGPEADPTVFRLTDIEDITFRYQLSVDEADDSSFVDVPFFDEILGDSVEALAFGSFHSPSYRDPLSLAIPAFGTRRGQPQALGSEEVHFLLILPAGPRPAGGWPVVIYGHGDGPGKNFDPLLVANALTERGLALIAINAVGYGGGAAGSLSVQRASSEPLVFSAGGRGRDIDGDGLIGGDISLPEGYSGRLLPLPRDGRRQTVIDMMQLVRLLEAGVDLDEDGLPDLDRAEISYLGVSLGSYHGPLLMAVEPEIGSAVFNTGGGAAIDLRLSVAHRSQIEALLASWQPPLTNVGDPTSCVLSSCDLRFEASLPLRDRPPLTQPAAGSMAIQEVFERAEWLSQSGNPVAYARHLRQEPLAGVDDKNILFQVARGDLQVPNPSTSAVLRAGDLADRATLYRHELVLADPDRPAAQEQLDAHPFLFFTLFPDLGDVGLAAQIQMAEYLASGGTLTLDPDGPGPIFEVPISTPLPETCNYPLAILGFEHCF